MDRPYCGGVGIAPTKTLAKLAIMLLKNGVRPAALLICRC